MSIYDVLVSLGISDDVAATADFYASSQGLGPSAQHKLTCCVVKKYAAGKYTQLAQEHPEIVVDCSPEDDCVAILTPAGL